MLKVGQFEITRIEEMMLIEPVATFAGIGEAELATHRAWLVPTYYNEAENGFATSIHVWLVRAPGFVALVDTGGGNDKERPLSPRFHIRSAPFLAMLAKAGVTREDVTHVLLTHLHVDHVGWNTMLVDGRWEPTFPNASYIMSAREVAWRDPARTTAERPAAAYLPFEDSVKPILNSGLTRLVEGTETILDGLDLMPLPGHTPHQMGIRLRSGGEEAIFPGDVMHQPVQVCYPEVNSKYCEVQDVARTTRAALLRHAVETGAILLPAHFGHPFGGRIAQDKTGGYRFVPLPEVP